MLASFIDANYSLTQIPSHGLINPQFISNDGFGSIVVPQRSHSAYRITRRLGTQQSRTVGATTLRVIAGGRYVKSVVVVLFIDGIMAN